MPKFIKRILLLLGGTLSVSSCVKCKHVFRESRATPNKIDRSLQFRLQNFISLSLSLSLSRGLRFASFCNGDNSCNFEDRFRRMMGTGEEGALVFEASLGARSGFNLNYLHHKVLSPTWRIFITERMRMLDCIRRRCSLIAKLRDFDVRYG